MTTLAWRALHVAILLFIGVLLANSAVSTAQPAKGSSDGEVIVRARRLLSIDDPQKLRNEGIPGLYDLGHDSRLTELYRKVWADDRNDYPDIAWATLNRPDVRIAFAQFWGQYVRNTTYDRAQMAETRSYVTRFLNDPGAAVRADAVNYLGALGTKADVPFLLKTCAEDIFPVAINAVHSLRILLKADATGPLEDCRQRTSNNRLKEAIDPVLRSLKR